MKVLFFLKPRLNNFFPHGGFSFPQATLILQSWGMSDIGHRYYGSKTRQSGLGIKCQTDKKITLPCMGIKPWTILNISCVRITKITSLHMECNCNCHGKHNRDIHVEHDCNRTRMSHVECGQQRMDDGQTVQIFYLGKKMQDSCFDTKSV